MKTIKLISILALMLLTSVTAKAQNSLVGDVNKDGSVNIADVTMVVDIILNGQKELSLSASEIFLRKENSATIKITSGYGSYKVSSTDTNIADAMLSGSMVIITGKNGGTTVVKVIDAISGNMKDVSVTVNDDTPVSYSKCPDENHPHLIDLGLPSGTRWACCNVGADKPEAYGGYYAWGETDEKETYTFENYAHCDGSFENYHDLGNDISGTEHDVAHVKWGGSWVMPSTEQRNELINNCTYEWTTVNNIYGCKLTSKTNGCSIFLPAAGYRSFSDINYNGEGDLYLAGEFGYYWLSTQNLNNSFLAYCLEFLSHNAFWSSHNRCNGLSVRPVVRK